MHYRKTQDPESGRPVVGLLRRAGILETTLELPNGEERSFPTKTVKVIDEEDYNRYVEVLGSGGQA